MENRRLLIRRRQIVLVRIHKRINKFSLGKETPCRGFHNYSTLRRSRFLLCFGYGSKTVLFTDIPCSDKVACGRPNTDIGLLSDICIFFAGLEAEALNDMPVAYQIRGGSFPQKRKVPPLRQYRVFITNVRNTRFFAFLFLVIPRLFLLSYLS